jgi:hypothetical protein
MLRRLAPILPLFGLVTMLSLMTVAMGVLLWALSL